MAKIHSSGVVGQEAVGDDREKIGGTGEREVSLDRPLIGDKVDLLALDSVDPALNRKMHIVNNVSTTFSVWIALTGGEAGNA